MMHKLLELHKALGVVFIGLLVLAVWLTYAVFTKAFTEYDEVTLQTTSIGLQLPERADVKIRGVIVGEVLDTRSAGGDAAEVTLGIFPEQTETIPAEVTGAIVPKTLFGEKYVSLEIPESAPQDGPSIQAGARITKSELSTEVEQVLRDIYPLLRTVQPADLNLTLNALATALEGRGEALGENLERLDSYLERMNPEIPAFLDDLRLTAEVSDTYAEILPEVATILDNTVKTAQTLEDREVELNAMLQDIRSFAATAQGFLDANGDLIERFGRLTVQQLRVLRKYAPEFPCLTKGLVNASELLTDAFRDYELHIILELLPNQPRRWQPRDQHRNGETRGPDCLSLPEPTWDQQNTMPAPPDFDDGIDEPTGKGTSRVPPGFDTDPAGYDDTPADREVLRRLLGTRYGDATATDLGVVLAAPLAAGGER